VYLDLTFMTSSALKLTFYAFYEGSLWSFISHRDGFKSVNLSVCMWAG